MKQFKLWVHQHTFSENELIVNPKEFPDCKEGDVFEIYDPGEPVKAVRLLLQINNFIPDFQQKDTISILHSVANQFQLRTYWDVQVNKVDPKDVGIELAEILIKDQYLSRNDMWRLSKALDNTCVYVNKKVSSCGIRCQIYELWTKGEKVSCGVINKDTRIVYRSLTAQVFLFIQMSQEMWDFDLNGDLYFEKTIHGFLYELFSKWKEQNATHEVTIVLFSRTFYDAKFIEDFPPERRPCILQDSYRRFYEDFYHVVIQREKRDDWLPVLVTLKHHFTQYPKYINCYHDEPGVPAGCNSTAFDGNILEAYNLTMNIFEKHFVDRTFDRTGQTTVIVTPGPGVFEVDRSLTSIIKQRMVDSGVATDLVCMAEQPLHSVPLFKFRNKDLGQGVSLGDDYNIAHWVNHSFYSSANAKTQQDEFVPRIKVPDVILNSIGGDVQDNPFRKGLHKNFQPKDAREQLTTQLPDRVNYDAYDADIFRTTSNVKPLTDSILRQGSHSMPDVIPKVTSLTDIERLGRVSEESGDEMRVPRGGASRGARRALSPPAGSAAAIAIPGRPNSPGRHSTHDPVRTRLSSSLDFSSYATKDYHKNRTVDDNLKKATNQRFTVGSAGSINKILDLRPAADSHRRRTLINPFKPLNIPCKWMCNRHRWAHVFPKSRDGAIVRRHFEKQPSVDESPVQKDEQPEVEGTVLAAIKSRSRAISEASKATSEGPDSVDGEENEYEEEESSSSQSLSETTPTHTPQDAQLVTTPQAHVNRRRSLRPNFFYHTFDLRSVEHDWTAAIKTKVDWKSLVVPACLPLTSEYNPYKESLRSYYLEFHYELCVGDEDYTSARPRSSSRPSEGLEELRRSRHPTTVEQALLELVAQRLSRGFQISTSYPKISPDRPQSFPRNIPCDDDFETDEYFLSLGRNLHRLSVIPNRSQINVTRYRPRHPSSTSTVKYRYRLWTGKGVDYQPHQAEFQHDELDKYNWNYLDQHIIGDQEFSELLENLKYWKSRFLLLPLSRRKGNNAGPDGQDGKSDNITDESARIEGLLKFIEILNGVKRTNARRRPFSPKKSLGNVGKDPRARAQTLPDSESAPKEGAGGGPLTGKTIALSSSLGPVDSGGESRRHSSVDGLSEPSSPGVDEPAVTTEGDVLSVKSPLEAIVDAMIDPKGGMTFLPSLKGLDSKCFLAIEAVWWLMHHVDGVADRNGAVALAQKMLEARVILHASKSTRQNFFYGFAIFQFANEKLRSEVEEKPGRYAHYHRTLMEQQLKDFQGDWVEIAFTQYAPPSVIPAFLAPDSALEMIPLTSPTLRSLASVRRGRAKSASQQAMLMGECACAYKLVNLDCDPQHKSDRPEWCTLRYHGNYNPAHAFEMEVHWIEATGSIVHDMVQSWARKATSCGFVLVPAPVSPFPDPSSGNIDPLRLPIFIPLNLSGCIVDERDSLFKDFSVSSHRLRRYLFQEAILERFGFLKDSPYGPLFNTFTFVATPVQCRADDFVHVSGTAFVRIHDQDEDVRLDLYGPVSSGLLGERGSGFYWETNYMLSKRWRSASTGDLESARKLKAEFVEFCSDTKGVLRAFWESCKDEVRKAAEEKLRSERLKIEEISLTSESEETAGSFTDTDTEGTGAE